MLPLALPKFAIGNLNSNTMLRNRLREVSVIGIVFVDKCRYLMFPCIKCLVSESFELSISVSVVYFIASVPSIQTDLYKTL